MTRFSATVLEHFRHPRHVVPLPWPDGTAWVRTPTEDKVIRIQVCVAEGRVSHIAFSTHGSAPAIACGSWVCDWALGQTVQAVQRLTPPMVLDGLGGLPDHRREHADLTVQALQQAVAQAVTSPQSWPGRTP